MNNPDPKHSAFTLIELLVVISIIAILAGITVPTFFTAKTRASEAKARTTVKNLEIAFKAYLDTYKVWPDTWHDGEITGDIYRALRGENAQGIAFFEFESFTNLLMDPETAYDPWSNPRDSGTHRAYQVKFDKDYDNKISIGGKDVYRCVAVWSVGYDRQDNLGGGDDLASWR